MRIGWTALAIVALAWWPLSCPLQAQQACRPAWSVAAAQGEDFFSEQQESQLGDALGSRVDDHLIVTADPQITGFMADVGDSLLKQLPPTQYRFQYFVVDLPVPNAFSLPGGRIYVSRKLILSLQSRSELAGILAHEMGHIVTRQEAVAMTSLMRQVLGVTRVTSRADIVTNVNRLLDSEAHDPDALRQVLRREAPNQLAADRVAIYAMARAGYRPESFVQVFNRLAQTDWRTGDWLTNIFHATPPDEARLRDMQQLIQTLPAACVAQQPQGPDAAFAKWQASVLNFSAWAPTPSLPGLVRKLALSSPLRNDFERLKFSSDGRYLLAQDFGSVYVLSRSPLRWLFTIPAPDAHAAQFSPDSKSVVFEDPDLRVEVWSVASGKRTSVEDVTAPSGCSKSVVAPDGSILACIGTGGNLDLIDVATSRIFLTKKGFSERPVTVAGVPLHLLTVTPSLQFSPDGRYFLATLGTNRFAFDVAARREVRLRGALSSYRNFAVDFVNSQTVVASQEFPQVTVLRLVSFPAGKILSGITMRGVLQGVATNGEYAIVRSFRQPSEIALLDMKKSKIALTDSLPAVDAYGDFAASQMVDGEIAIYRLGVNTPLAGTSVTGRSLNGVHFASVSPALKWLAMSSRYRGGVWDLQDGRLAYRLRGFDGAYWSPDGWVYTDFPSYAKLPNVIGGLNLARYQERTLRNVTAPNAIQFGRYLDVTDYRGGGNHGVSKTVIDILSGKVAWSGRFDHDAPTLAIDSRSSTLAEVWAARVHGARMAIQQNPRLERAFDSLKPKQPALFVKITSLSDGATLGELLAGALGATGGVRDAFASDGWFFLLTGGDRAFVYSMSSGAQVGDVPGIAGTLSEAANRFAVQANLYEIDIYALPSMTEIDRLVFSKPVLASQLGLSGKRLCVVTQDQTVWLFTITPREEASGSAKS